MNELEASDADRYPLLSESGRGMLRFLREHPRAPIYRNHSGNRLSADDLDFVLREEATVLNAALGWSPGSHPDWLEGFVDSCLENVPAFRGYPGSTRFEELPTTTRADLGRDIAAYVPDSVPLERMICFETSGTTGHPLSIPSHPRVAAGYLAYHKRALKRFGVELSAGPDQVGVVLLGHQLTCFTYVSVTPSMREAGLAKINLHPNDWHHPSDRRSYLEALDPEVIAGDPISFNELIQITPELRPKALLSTSMTLLPGLRQRLSIAFACPVLDLYSLNEAGPVAAFDPELDGHVLIQPRMYVETLDSSGRPVAPGERGEVTLTGGFNFCLPLLRYRTGDFAVLDHAHGEPMLTGLEGRATLRFRRPDGVWLNNVDVTHALRPLPLARFSLHQRSPRDFEFAADGPASAIHDARESLTRLFGPAANIVNVDFDNSSSGKHAQYRSDLPGADT